MEVGGGMGEGGRVGVRRVKLRTAKFISLTVLRIYVSREIAISTFETLNNSNKCFRSFILQVYICRHMHVPCKLTHGVCYSWQLSGFCPLKESYGGKEDGYPKKVGWQSKKSRRVSGGPPSTPPS